MYLLTGYEFFIRIKLYSVIFRFMPETINEPVAVDLVSRTMGEAFPYVVSWRKRRYMVTKIGLHHTTRQGRTLMHIYSVMAGGCFFKLRFDTETLRWELVEIEAQ